MRERIIDLLELWFTVSDTDLIVDVRDDYCDPELMDQLLLYPIWVDEMLIGSK